MKYKDIYIYTDKEIYDVYRAIHIIRVHMCFFL